jgi:hypothetical protein
MEDGTDEQEPLAAAIEPSVSTGAVNLVPKSLEWAESEYVGFRGVGNGAPPRRTPRRRIPSRKLITRRVQSRIARPINLSPSESVPLAGKTLNENLTPNTIVWGYERIIPASRDGDE